MKRIATAIIVVILILVIYWYFIGGSLTTKFVNETIPSVAEPAFKTLPTVDPKRTTSSESSTPATTQIVESRVIKQGYFTVIDSVHKGSGIAKVIQNGAKYYLFLEDFKVTNGPDLYVYLSHTSDIKNEKELGEYKEIAPLKGNEGNQVYEITEEDAKNFSSVVIWCKRFGVLFSSATLTNNANKIPEQVQTRDV